METTAGEGTGETATGVEAAEERAVAGIGVAVADGAEGPRQREGPSSMLGGRGRGGVTGE
jgi:hypothetical protein